MPTDDAPHQPDAARPDAALPAPDPEVEALLHRLCGQVEGRRVLLLGVDEGDALTAFAGRGARVIGVEPRPERIDAARRRCAAAGLRVELHHADLAELAFVRADAIDVVVSPAALAGVADLNRVFRQAHRVLRQDGPLVLALPHPVGQVVTGGHTTAEVGRSYFDRTPLQRDGGAEHHHTVADVFTGLVRANFRVDTLLEPEPPGPALVPRTLVLRGRKEGR